jgi:hypothetical protein
MPAVYAAAYNKACHDDGKCYVCPLIVCFTFSSGMGKQEVEQDPDKRILYPRCRKFGPGVAAIPEG